MFSPTLPPSLPPHPSLRTFLRVAPKGWASGHFHPLLDLLLLLLLDVSGAVGVDLEGEIAFPLDGEGLV